MAVESTAVNRRFLLRERPQGEYDPRILERVEEPIPEPGPGEALVRNEYLSLDPTNLVWMRKEDSYLPPVKLGAVMRGGGLGRIIASNNPAWKVGRRVGGMLNWQDYCIIGRDDELAPQILPRFLPAPLTSTLSVLGVTGMTAYFGLLDIGKPKRGDTVVVSAAAGAVGSVVGQIAKIYGARAVGIVGSREKCEWLTRDLGFDAAICRRDAHWREQLTAACPNGVDVNFENAGGEIMEAVIDLMNLQGRIVLCGMISQYGNESMEGVGPRNFVQLLFKRLKVQGFIILDYIDRFPVAQLRMAYWLKRGKLVDRQTTVHGLDQAPQALLQLYRGDNVGKLIVQIDDSPTRR